MPAFFSNLDVLALPSLNSTESFGIVQIEAMTKGVPTVASDIPGVRQPVKMHGMGKIFPAGDAAALAGCLLEILGNRQAFIREPQPIQVQYLPDTIAESYERLFLEIKDEMKAARG